MVTVHFFYDNGYSANPAGPLISFGAYLLVYLPAMVLFWARYDCNKILSM